FCGSVVSGWCMHAPNLINERPFPCFGFGDDEQVRSQGSTGADSSPEPSSHYRNRALSRPSAKEQMVPRRGLEPPRPFERRHLKTVRLPIPPPGHGVGRDRKSTRLNSSHVKISYAVFCL